MNPEAVLGIDTSCYTTSCAIVSMDMKVLASIRLPLTVAFGEKGLRQSEAVFQHVRQLPDAIERALESSYRPGILAVSASEAPTHREGSYMPVFAAGLSFARSIAQALGVPCFTASHQQGHFAAARIGVEELPDTHLGMHLSGGTTEVVLIEGEGLLLLLGTNDISAGQLMDRVGVALGLPFPAGPEMERLAGLVDVQGRYSAIVREGTCSFSGAEAAALRDVAEGLPAVNIAAEVYDCISRTALKMATSASKATGIKQLLVTGGVASSKLLRRLMETRAKKRGMPLQLYFGQAQYAGDNAAGLAMIGVEKLHKLQEV
ncbi:MAG: hypothetical protein PHP02_05725 [Eubacteriales bacterium]|nr:hypothetical protein [Eubacteriales bacterium]